jgi:hypothetical protein
LSLLANTRIGTAYAVVVGRFQHGLINSVDVLEQGNEALIASWLQFFISLKGFIAIFSQRVTFINITFLKANV